MPDSVATRAALTRTSPAENGAESRLALWRRSRRWYRLKICLVLTAFAAPGNAFVLFCAITTSQHTDDVQQPPPYNEVEENDVVAVGEEENDPNLANSSMFVCYEDLTVWTDRLSRARFIVEGILLTMIGGIGILGNLISLVVLCAVVRKKSSSFNSLLIVLAVADSIFLTFHLFDLAYFDAFGNDWPDWYNDAFVAVVHPGKAVSMTATVYLVVAVAANRHAAICSPIVGYNYRPGARSVSAAVIFASFAVNAPKFFDFRVVRDANVSYVGTTALNEDSRYTRFVPYFELLTTGLLPLAALCFYNAEIYAKIRRSSKMKGRIVVGGSGGNTAASQSHQGNNGATAAAAAAAGGGQTIFSAEDTEEEVKKRSHSCSLSTPSNATSQKPSRPNFIVKQASESSATTSAALLFRHRWRRRGGRRIPEDDDDADSIRLQPLAPAAADSDDIGGNAPVSNGVCRTESSSSSSVMVTQAPKSVTRSASACIRPPTIKPKFLRSKKADKSTTILVGIILVFLVCHALRFR